MVSRRMSRFAFAASPARPGVAVTASVRTAASRMRERGIVGSPFPRRLGRRLLADPRDLRSLDADPGHETLLVEDEGVHVARDRVAGDGLPDALVDDDDARADAELETVGRVELVERGVVHEEERVAELLYARLEAVGRGDGVVVAGHLAVLAQHALTDLAPEHEAGLDDPRKDEDPRRLLPENLRARLLRVEITQGRGRLAGELGGRGGVRGARSGRGQRGREQDATKRQRSGGSHDRLLSSLVPLTWTNPPPQVVKR